MTSDNNRRYSFGIIADTALYAFICLTLLAPLTGMAQTMRVHTKAGVTEFNLGSIDSITFFTIPTYQDSDITTGMVLHMNFENNLSDTSGYGNNGGAANQTFTADPWGHPNSAYLLNGNNNYITVPNSASLNPADQWTVASWFRLDSITSNYITFLQKGGAALPCWSNREYALHIKQNFSSYYFLMYAAGDGSCQHEVDSYSYSVGQWIHLVGVYDRRNHVLKIYVNGQLTGQQSDSYSTFNVSDRPLLIGISEESDPQYTPVLGAIDDLRMYNRALTDMQVQLLYKSH